ncbi:MAG: DUF969 domain-containing protein [Treponema sp.]|nr:DUF969 domain-containing protein [Treponema sp.]
MEFTELIRLVGIVVVIVGFAFKLEPILIILLGIAATALAAWMNPVTLLATIGSSFVANRVMATFILILLVTGTMERNGLRESAAKLIGRFKGASPGAVIAGYGIMRSIFGIFNVSFGGVAGFVRPVVMPMALGTVKAGGNEPEEKHVEEIKGMASGMENVAWFFFQVLFITGAGNLLVQSTLAGLGYEVELIELVKVAIPVAIFALVWGIVYYYRKDAKLMKAYAAKPAGSDRSERTSGRG